MTLVVTRVRPRDWRRLRDVRLSALADAPDMFGSTLDREQAFDEEEWRRRAERPTTFLASRGGPDVGMDVGTDVGTDVGMAGVYEFDAGWCVMGMWIAPLARGTGVVDALVAACESVARDAGATTIALRVMEDNQRGIRAYTRLGYAQTGIREQVREGRVEVAMAKTLRAP